MLHNAPATIVHLINSLDGGGTERTLVSLLRSFDPVQLRHVVVPLRDAGTMASLLPQHVACRPLAVRGRSRLAWIRLARLARRSDAAVIHARNTGCWADAVLAGSVLRGVHVVLGFHGLQNTGPFSSRQRTIVKWAVHRGAGFTSASEAGRRQLCEWGGVPPERVEVLTNGVDLQRFTPPYDDDRDRMRRALGIRPDAFVMGSVGSLTPIKRYDVLLDATARTARSLGNLHLVVVGDGPLREKLQSQAGSAGIEDIVTFTGMREDIPDLLACMDVYICSSESEGMSNALLEASAAGLPCIATDVGDNALLVRDGVEGLIIRPGSPMLLADAITQLARAETGRWRMGEAARARARNHDFRATVRRYEEYYVLGLMRTGPRGSLWRSSS